MKEICREKTGNIKFACGTELCNLRLENSIIRLELIRKKHEMIYFEFTNEIDNIYCAIFVRTMWTVKYCTLTKMLIKFRKAADKSLTMPEVSVLSFNG